MIISNIGHLGKKIWSTLYVCVDKNTEIVYVLTVINSIRFKLSLGTQLRTARRTVTVSSRVGPALVLLLIMLPGLMMMKEPFISFSNRQHKHHVRFDSYCFFFVCYQVSCSSRIHFHCAWVMTGSNLVLLEWPTYGHWGGSPALLGAPCSCSSAASALSPASAPPEYNFFKKYIN